jgi:hypothetical protein
MLVVALIPTLLLSRGPLTIIPGVLGLDLHTMLLGITMATLRYSTIQLDTPARVFYSFNPRRPRRLAERFTYDRGMVVAGAMATIGILVNLVVLVNWLRKAARVRARPARRAGCPAEGPWEPPPGRSPDRMRWAARSRSKT